MKIKNGNARVSFKEETTKVLKSKIYPCIFAVLAFACPTVQADFSGDASTVITLRNFYFYRNYLTHSSIFAQAIPRAPLVLAWISPGLVRLG